MLQFTIITTPGAGGDGEAPGCKTVALYIAL